MGTGRSKIGRGGGADMMGSMQVPSKEEQIAQLEEQLANTKGLFAKGKIRDQIEMLKTGYEGTLEEYRKEKYAKQEAQRQEAQKHYEEQKAKEAREKAEQEARKQRELENELRTQPKEKVEQYRIIQENNPANDDYHTWIRKPSDIKTWSEVINEYKKDGDGFSWGDFSLTDAQKALQTGKIKVYSSYKIGQGIFVSTSKAQAEQYAGGTGRKVFSKIVNLEDVAWINGDEGQYAKRKKNK